MKISIVVSAPPMRQVFRGVDVRAVAVVVERALWPLLEAGLPVSVTVQCGNARTQAQLNTYFQDMVRDEREFRARADTNRTAV
jgi:hypothetical protein